MSKNSGVGVGTLFSLEDDGGYVRNHGGWPSGDPKHYRKVLMDAFEKEWYKIRETIYGHSDEPSDGSKGDKE